MTAKSDPAWPRGWDEHSENQARRLAALPFAEKLAWLEEAHRLVLQLNSTPKPR